MANNGPIVNQHFQQHNNQFHCKECGLFFDSSKSLDVHLQYHKENLLTKWASQATQNNPTSGAGDEANNNNTKSGINIKREFNTSHANTIAAAADSSDANMKSNNKSPDAYTSRATPETSASFGHPSTPQSFHSAASPYQNADATNTFSPGFHAYHKGDRASPATHYSGFNHQQATFEGQYFSMEPPSYQDYGSKPTFRYHPYNTGGHHAQVSSSSRSPSYAGAQTTPSPSPKQCDKCGFVCDSASQLVEHLQMAHPPTPFQQQQQLHHQQQQFQFSAPGSNDGSGPPEIKQENEPQAEILDLDSHKVHVYQTPEEQEEAMKRQNAELAAMNGGGVHNPHSVSAMLSSWPNNSQQKQFAGVPPNSQEQRIYTNGPEQTKMFGNGMHEEKMFANAHEQKLFQPHQMHGSEFLTGNVSTTTHDVNGQNMGMPNMNVPQQQQVPQPYRPFEHVPPQPNPPVISSTQVPNSIPPANLPTPVVTKGANWKSNEARRPKTYNCSACNKWFTSSGHLKRHYNTTLHKNAVKSSGQPDPATLPISAHHHPNRDPNHQSSHQKQDGNSQSPSPLQVSGPPDDRDDNGMVPPYERAQHPGLLQQPPSGPYDRHPPNIGGPPQAPGLHSPLSQNPSLSNSLTNLSSTSPPNGEAGPSANNIDHSRGLLSISTPNTPHRVTPLSPMVPMSPASNQLPPFNLLNQQSHMMGMPSPTASGQVFHTMPQITGSYPNGLSPHVTQTMVATNNQPQALISLTSTGELEQSLHTPGHGPLPSFSQFQSLLLAGFTPVISNVGGPGPVTDPHLAYPTFAQYAGPVDAEYITGDLNSPQEAEASLPYSNHDHIVYRTHSLEPMEYHMTSLHPMPTEYIKQEIEEPYSPPNHNNNDGDGGEIDGVNSVCVKEKELETSSPLITSTGSPMSMKIQQATSIHKCIDCDKVFNKACYLTQHNKTFHCGDKPFKCNRCGKRFSDEQSYQEHSSKHAGEKPHKCELCPKQFNHKTDLRRHMCLHTGQKPYSCETCGKGFIRKDHMLKHCETHLRKSVRNSTAAQNTNAAILGFP